MLFLLACRAVVAADLATGLISTDTTKKDTIAKPDTVKYDSDSLDYDAETRRILLMGHAHLQYRQTKLSADSIDFDQSSQILDARGNPDVEDPQIAPFKGGRLRYNLKTRYGAVFGARSYRNGEYYRGAEIRRLPDKTLQVVDGDFCKCQGVNEPDYYFASEKMEIEPDRQATAAPVVLNIEEVPVLVAPFVLFPLGKGRRSGFLTPKLGGDQKQGFFARNLGFYYGISDYMDLTTATDVVEGNAGRFDQLNGDANFRYADRYWLTGNVEGKRYLRELGGQGSGWEVRYTHDQQLLPEPGKFTLKGQGAFVSTSSVRSTNALSAADILDQTANANLTTQYRIGSNSSVTASLSQEENLRTGIRTQEIPAASFQSAGQLIPSDDPDDTAWYRRDLTYRYTAKFSNFSDRAADSINKAQHDAYLARPDSVPLPRPLDQNFLGATENISLTATHKVGYIDLSADANAQHDWSGYSYTAPPSTMYGAYRPYTDGYEPDNVVTWNLSTHASTNIYGIWMPYWGSWAGLRHTLTPSVGYRFVPHIDSHEFFVPNPRLGQITGQNKAQLMELGLGQKLDTKILDPAADTAKGKSRKGTPYPIMDLRTSTSYDFEKTVRPWADIVTSYSTGIPQIQFTGTLVHTLYDPWGDSLTEGAPLLKSWSLSFGKGTRVTGSLTDGWRWDEDSISSQPWSLSMDYSYSIQAVRVSRSVFQETRTQTAGFGAEVQPSRDWKASWRSSYNFELGSFVAHSLNFHRSLGCWDMNFGWTPVGPARGWTFLIQIRDLPDAKLQAQSSTLRKISAAATPGTTTVK